MPAPVHILNRREEPPADQTKMLEPEAIESEGSEGNMNGPAAAVAPPLVPVTAT
jgi:hypothetical protein